MGRKGRLLLWIFLALGGVTFFSLPWADAGWIGQRAPEFTNTVWINSAPLRIADLQGKVILLEFWTYG